MTTQTAIDLDAQVAALTQRLTETRKARARADAEMDAARASRDNVLATLTKDFGVTTPEEARDTLERLQGEVTTEISALREALDAMEGQG